MSGRLVLDTGGMLARVRGDRRAAAATDEATARFMQLIIPAVVLTQCIRGGQRDAPLNRLIRGHCEVIPVTEELARQAGILLAPLTGPQAPPRADQPDAVRRDRRCRRPSAITGLHPDQ